MITRAHRTPASLPNIHPCQRIAILSMLSLALFAGFSPVHAQEPGQVQELTGTLGREEIQIYLLPNLESGQTLYVYAHGTSGNLDPIVGLVDAREDPEALLESHLSSIEQAVEEGRDPVVAAQVSADKLFLTWDDDSGGGLASAFAVPIPAAGDYRLFLTSVWSQVGLGTFGDYRLFVGLDAPQVLEGEASPTGDMLAVPDREASPPGVAVQELSVPLTTEEHLLELRDLRPADTLYVFAEATSGDLRPVVALLNFADKPVSAANVGGQDLHATLEYASEQGGHNYKLAVVGCCGEEAEPGEVRLLVGVNEPDVLTGVATSRGQPIVELPIPVQIGIKLQQIVDVDEKNEFFTAVASLQMEWTDPTLAFSPESCDCVLKVYALEDFDQFVADTQGRWPAFTLYNQQGNRWTQNRVVTLSQDGHAVYFERFSTDLQVDFDFRRYPFDWEEFIVLVDSIAREEHFYFTDLEGYSEISAGHGEDEFRIDSLETEVTSERASRQVTTSRFTFRFGGPRNLNYYLLQIFVPVLLIAVVSWITFFLRDYGRRIEVASGNLLLFIAFSFSLSDNYPRLGYVTLLDVVMVVMFVVNALVIAYNVWLRRLEMRGQGDLAERIDSYLDWFYPLSYVVAAAFLYLVFF
jgi:hypothetical protein